MTNFASGLGPSMVLGGGLSAFFLLVRLTLHYQKTMTDAAFQRADHLSLQLAAAETRFDVERRRCDTLEDEVRNLRWDVNVLTSRLNHVTRNPDTPRSDD